MIDQLKHNWQFLSQKEKREIANFVAKEMQPLSSGTAELILADLNKLAKTNFRPVKSNLKLIQARLNEGHSFEDIEQVVARKCLEWRDNPAMAQYLRPATLFNAEKFNQYVGQLSMEVPRGTNQGQSTSRTARVTAELKRIAEEDIRKNGFTDKLD